MIRSDRALTCHPPMTPSTIGEVFRLRQAAGMHHLAVDDDARRRGDSVAGDGGVVGDFLD